MNNWQKYRNFRKFKNADNSCTCIVTVDGVKVEVSEEVYKEYAEIGRRIEYMECDLKRDRILQGTNGKAVMDDNGQPIILPEREVSLDRLIAEGRDFPASGPSPEEAAIRQLETCALYRCLDLLAPDERSLINVLFFEGMTIREHAGRTGKTKSGIDRQKTKILGKLNQLMARAKF